MRLSAIAGVLGAVVAASCCGSSRAGSIGPGDFGPGAIVQSFDSLAENYYGAYGPVVLHGVSYATSLPGSYNVASGSDCFSGLCFATRQSSSGFLITLDAPVMRVGGYINGRSDQTPYVIFYDANYVGLDGLAPFLVNENSFFFGFQAASNNIKYVQISPNAGQNIATLDNFTYELVSLPAPVPSPTAGVGLSGLALWAAVFSHGTGGSVRHEFSQRVSPNS